MRKGYDLQEFLHKETRFKQLENYRTARINYW